MKMANTRRDFDTTVLGLICGIIGFPSDRTLAYHLVVGLSDNLELK
jgi:hypothetical protein